MNKIRTSIDVHQYLTKLCGDYFIKSFTDPEGVTGYTVVGLKRTIVDILSLDGIEHKVFAPFCEFFSKYTIERAWGNFSYTFFKEFYIFQIYKISNSCVYTRSNRTVKFPKFIDICATKLGYSIEEVEATLKMMQGKEEELL